MLKQIKTLGLVLVIGSLLVGCDETEYEDININDTKPAIEENVEKEPEVEEQVVEEEPEVEEQEEPTGYKFNYDLKIIGKTTKAINFEKLTKVDIKLINKYVGDFIQLAIEHAEILNNGGEIEFGYAEIKGDKYNSKNIDLAELLNKVYAENNETYAGGYLEAIYDIALIENQNIVETIEFNCYEHDCNNIYITDKYTTILDGYYNHNCGCEYDGEYLVDHRIEIKDAINVISNYVRRGQDVPGKNYPELLINAFQPQEDELVVMVIDEVHNVADIYEVDLNTRVINIIEWLKTDELEDYVLKVYGVEYKIQ